MLPGSPYSGSLGSDICSPSMAAYTSRIIMQAIPARVIEVEHQTSVKIITCVLCVLCV